MTLCHKKETHEMTLTDIHTHNSATENAIFNSGKEYITDRNISMGIHPWEIDANWECEFASIAEFAKVENVVAIGECGFDTLKYSAPIELQENIFRSHALLAERVKKPLIIHCVKAYDRIMALYKEIEPQQAWIIHGFRGKPELARQLVKTGFHISLGEKFNPQSATVIPLERLFIESDESTQPLAVIYEAVAAAKKMPIGMLAQQIEANTRIFIQF